MTGAGVARRREHRKTSTPEPETQASGPILRDWGTYTLPHKPKSAPACPTVFALGSTTLTIFLVGCHKWSVATYCMGFMAGHFDEQSRLGARNERPLFRRSGHPSSVRRGVKRPPRQARGAWSRCGKGRHCVRLSDHVPERLGYSTCGPRTEPKVDAHSPEPRL
jgi:hypothetical protein